MRAKPEYILEVLPHKLHELWNLVSLTIWNYVVLDFSFMDVIFCPVTLLVFYNVQKINLAFVDQI